jgi:hypothetical protein
MRIVNDIPKIEATVEKISRSTPAPTAGTEEPTESSKDAILRLDGVDGKTDAIVSIILTIKTLTALAGSAIAQRMIPTTTTREVTIVISGVKNVARAEKKSGITITNNYNDKSNYKLKIDLSMKPITTGYLRAEKKSRTKHKVKSSAKKV